MSAPRPLPRSFFGRPTLSVARDLIGCLVVHRVRGRARIGRIVETEAYIGTKDLACHASRGRTPRAEVLFGPPGRAYVFLVYGMHHCLNVVTERDGFPAAVLIRAVEPVQGCRGATNGPGKLTAALGIDMGDNRVDLCGGALFIAAAQRRPAAIDRAPRVGVDYAGPWAKKPWRFFEVGNPFVSRGDGTRPTRMMQRSGEPRRS